MNAIRTDALDTGVTADSLLRRDAQPQRRILGDPVRHNHAPLGYFDHDPDMTLAQRRDRLRELGRVGLSRLGIEAANFDADTFAGLEKIELKRAAEAARTSGMLFRKLTRDETGREVITYEGDPNVWMQDFKARGVHIKFNTHASQKFVPGHWEDR